MLMVLHVAPLIMLHKSSSMYTCVLSIVRCIVQLVTAPAVPHKSSHHNECILHSLAAPASQVAPPVLDLVYDRASQFLLWRDDCDVLRKVPVVGPRLIPDLEAVLKV